MAKRFSDSFKWDDPFFSNLSNEHKLLWIYMLDKCDHAGIFKVNKRMADFCLNTKVDWKAVEGAFKGRVYPLNSEKWFIIKFIEYQYGVLEENNRVHHSIIQILKKVGAYKLLTRPLQGAKEQEQEKDKDQDKDKDKDNINNFKEFISMFREKIGRQLTKGEMAEITAWWQKGMNHLKAVKIVLDRHKAKQSFSYYVKNIWPDYNIEAGRIYKREPLKLGDLLK